MVTAYLRGLLKPKLDYGLRSIASEAVVLEALSASIQADNLQTLTNVASASLPVLNHEGMNETWSTIQRRTRRIAELRRSDIYRFGHHQAQDAQSKKISLYQLYQLMDKSGIMKQIAANAPNHVP